MKARLIAINHASQSSPALSAQQHSLLQTNAAGHISTESELQRLTGVGKSLELKSVPYPVNRMIPLDMDRVPTNEGQTSTSSPSSNLSPPQTWFFNFEARSLRNTDAQIQLTAIESLLIKTLIMSTDRICSKPELILGADKDPHSYSGLEMCLSRLQHKFRHAFEERLFRSVRNRGYCLVQDVKIDH